MRDASTIMRERQLAVRREIDRRGIALKAVGLDSSIPYPTLLSYFPAGEREAAVMPLSAYYALADGKALPPDLLSLLLPNGWALVEIPEGLDHDELADAFADYLHAKNAAHHPESEAGRDIGPGEQAHLTAKVVQLPIVKGAA